MNPAAETNSYILCEAIHKRQFTNISNRSIWHVCLLMYNLICYKASTLTNQGCSLTFLTALAKFTSCLIYVYHIYIVSAMSSSYSNNVSQTSMRKGNPSDDFIKFFATLLLV